MKILFKFWITIEKRSKHKFKRYEIKKRKKSKGCALRSIKRVIPWIGNPVANTRHARLAIFHGLCALDVVCSTAQRSGIFRYTNFRGFNEENYYWKMLFFTVFHSNEYTCYDNRRAFSLLSSPPNDTLKLDESNTARLNLFIEQKSIITLRFHLNEIRRFVQCRRTKITWLYKHIALNPATLT